jgi:hypothetical protein
MIVHGNSKIFLKKGSNTSELRDALKEHIKTEYGYSDNIEVGIEACYVSPWKDELEFRVGWFISV